MPNINVDVEIDIDEFVRQADDMEAILSELKENYSINRIMNGLDLDEVDDVLGEWDENEVLEWLQKRKTSQWIVDELDTEVPEVNGLEVLTFIKKADPKYKLMILAEILSGVIDVK